MKINLLELKKIVNEKKFSLTKRGRGVILIAETTNNTDFHNK